MTGDENPSFVSFFEDLLRVELCRQGLAHSSEFASQCSRRVVLEGPNAQIVLSDCKLGDRECVAVAETLIKLSSPSMLKVHGVDHWMLLLSKNLLTDYCVTHLSLLISRCSPPLRYVDFRSNKITRAGAQQIEELRRLESPQCVLKFDYGEVQANNEGNDLASASSLSSIQPQSAASCSSIDHLALAKRRRMLFPHRDSSKECSNGALPQTLDSPTELKSLHDEDVKLGQMCESMPKSPEESEAKRRPSRQVPKTEGNRLPYSGSALTEFHRDNLNKAPQQPFPEDDDCQSGWNVRNDAGSTRRQNQVEKKSSLKQPDPYDEFPVDLTENLSPLLTSVMDLSDSVFTGKLRSMYDTDDIWSAVWSNCEKKSDSTTGDGEMCTPRSGPRGGSPFRSVTVLCLNRNGLRTLEALPPSLLRLDVSENKLCVISGLEKCRMLTLLNARHNHISCMRGFENNLSLSHLFLGDNEIEYVGGIAHLLLLETLDLAYNKLASQASIRPLSLCKGLKHLMLRGNPAMEKMKKCFRPLLRNLCPSLQFIDGARLASAQRSGFSTQVDSSKSVEGESLNTMSKRSNTSTSDHKDSTNASQCATYMHLLTRGVAIGGSGGYSDSVQISRAARAMAAHQKSDEEAKARLRRVVGGGGPPLREGIMKKLALDSKKYLEGVLAERLASVQQQFDVAPVDIEVSSEDTDTGNGSNELGEHTVKGASKGDTMNYNRKEGVEDCVTGDHTQRRGLTTKKEVASEVTHLKGKQKRPIEKNDSKEDRSAGNLRDNPLNHNQWIELRGKMDTNHPRTTHKQALPTREKSVSAAEKRAACGRSAPNLSPIRGRLTDRVVVSTLAKRFLSDMNGPFSDGTEQNVATPSHLQRPQAFEKSNVRTQQMLSPCSQCMKAKDVLCEPRAVVRGKRNVPSRDGKTTRGCRTRSREKSVISPTRAPPRRSPSVRRIRKVCEDWVVQLREDAEAVQQALQTVVILLSTQRQVLNAKECNGASQLHTFRRERQQCTQIIKNSGMLQDTEVPVEAVEFFAFTPEELNCVRADDSTLQDARDTMGMIADVNDTLAGKRREALNCIRLIGDAKTCLRYIVLLIEEENDRSLYKYVDEVTEFMTCEKEKLDRIEAMYTRA